MIIQGYRERKKRNPDSCTMVGNGGGIVSVVMPKFDEFGGRIQDDFGPADVKNLPTELKPVDKALLDANEYRLDIIAFYGDAQAASDKFDANAKSGQEILGKK